MRTPMFSILMVSLNPGGKLVETMESVVRQSYRDYEVIVKDGGSGDGSGGAAGLSGETGVPGPGTNSGAAGHRHL